MHTDVTTDFMGIKLRSPIIVGACPMTRKPETVREMTIAGAGAVVLPSLLEEQIVREMVQTGHKPSVQEQQLVAAGSPRLEDVYNGGVSSYLSALTVLKKYTGVPIIANLNGCAHGFWLGFASRVEAAGADAIELSLQTSVDDPHSCAADVENSLLQAVETVCNAVSIPVAVKLLPFFTSLPNLAERLADAGASGLVLFGREPIWEIFDGTLGATSRWSLSDTGQLQTTLSGLMRVKAGSAQLSIAASGGISTAKDVVHSVIAGADVAMLTSEIYRTGPDAIAHILEGLTQYLERHGERSFDSFANSCRAGAAKEEPRQRQLHPMLDTDRYQDPRPEPLPRSGDQWGHVFPAPHDD